MSEATSNEPGRSLPPGRGWLRNGNTPGDPNTAPRCGARTRTGAPCRSPAMKSGRCRMHGGASTGPATRVGRAICGHVRRKHPEWLTGTREEPRTANRAARVIRAVDGFARAWPNPFRRAKALLRLLSSVGRLLPERSDDCCDATILLTRHYVRDQVNDVLCWLGQRTLAPRERPDSERVRAALAGAVEACGIGDRVYRDLRRRALRQHAQRRRRAATRERGHPQADPPQPAS
jgi:hypothetical protein